MLTPAWGLLSSGLPSAAPATVRPPSWRPSWRRWSWRPYPAWRWGASSIAGPKPRYPPPAPYNALAAAERVFEANPEQIAAVIVEPVAGNMGVVPPRPDFLAGLREITRRHGALLIFDEVITGFRIAW